jgi:hypothetical protein
LQCNGFTKYVHQAGCEIAFADDVFCLKEGMVKLSGYRFSPALLLTVWT